MKKLALLLVLAFSVANVFAQGILDYNERDILNWYQQYSNTRNQQTKEDILNQLRNTPMFNKNNPEAGIKSIQSMMKTMAKSDKTGTFMESAGIYYLTDLFRTGKNQNHYTEAYNWFVKGAEKDRPLCKFYQAELLMLGNGVERDIQKALEILKNTELVDAYLAAGIIEFFGLGAWNKMKGRPIVGF